MLAVCLVTGSLVAEAAAPAPQRVISINLCTDELVLTLADRNQLLSVSHLVQDPELSWFAAQARNIPANYGRAEEIVTLQPDLVVAGNFTAPATIALLKKLGIHVLQFAMPRTIEEVEAQITVMARALGQIGRGAAVVADMQHRLASLPSLPLRGTPPTVALYQPNGLGAAEGTLVHDVMTTAGMRNLAGMRSLADYAQLPMEVLLLDQPDLLVMIKDDSSAPSLAQELLRHPALKKAFSASRTVMMPPQAWSCGSPYVVRAVEILRDAAIASIVTTLGAS